MTDRIPSDHATIESHRISLGTVGRTRRLQVELPDELECAVDDVVYLSLEGDGFHATITASLHGDAAVQDAFPTRQLARTRAGEDALRAWVDDTGLTAGDALVLDVLREGYAYGLRRPGKRVVYAPPEPPNSSLADIARNLDS